MDQIVEAVRKKLADRSAAGVRKYGTTMERTDLSRLDWLRHAQEELMDGAVYLERLIREEEALVAKDCQHVFLPAGKQRARCVKCLLWDSR